VYSKVFAPMIPANRSIRPLLASIRSIVRLSQALNVLSLIALGIALCCTAFASTGEVIVGGVQSQILATGSV